jgi:hypothetical protein
LVPPTAGGDDFVGISASCEGLCFSIALVSTKMKDVAFDSAELVVRRALRSFDQKKSVAYPGRFSVRVAIWLPRRFIHHRPISSTSTAVKPLTDPVRARKFAPRPVKGRSSRGIVTPLRACGPAGGSVAKGMKKISYRGYRQDLLAERGIMVSYETVRRWVPRKSGRDHVPLPCRAHQSAAKYRSGDP